jgi:hypothetical protein
VLAQRVIFKLSSLCNFLDGPAGAVESRPPVTNTACSTVEPVRNHWSLNAADSDDQTIRTWTSLTDDRGSFGLNIK